MTPDEEAKAQEFLDRWDKDWGFFAEHIATQRGVSRAEALMFIMAMQVGSMRDEFTRAQKHPEFRADCPHCVEQQRLQDVTARYMERAIKHMDECEGDDGWKPL